MIRWRNSVHSASFSPTTSHVQQPHLEVVDPEEENTPSWKIVQKMAAKWGGLYFMSLGLLSQKFMDPLLPRVKETHTYLQQMNQEVRLLYNTKAILQCNQIFRIAIKATERGLKLIPESKAFGPLLNSIWDINNHSRQCKRGPFRHRKQQNPSHFSTCQTLAALAMKFSVKPWKL